VDYFLELSHDKEKPIVIWGAGNKGKKVAQLLIEKKTPFEWVCDNPKKIGKDIYNHILKPFEYLNELKNYQSIITVANSEAQVEIKQYLNHHKKTAMKDYFFFC
jgi:FlaA1/EpsC-like NDP-sugar epimerase